MAFAGKSDKKENVTAAITANIWMSNEKSAKGALQEETLNYMVLDCLVGSMDSPLPFARGNVWPQETTMDPERGTN